MERYVYMAARKFEMSTDAIKQYWSVLFSNFINLISVKQNPLKAGPVGAGRMHQSSDLVGACKH